jgi:DNA helicase-2/ATP-dependent DNA helicase PcrA
MSVEKVFGPPGSGKTTYLLSVVDNELSGGVPSNGIGYFAFTRKAAAEATERAQRKFPHLDPEQDFPWFRTLHSLAYRCLGIGTKDMMTPQNYAEFAKGAGIELAIEQGEEEFAVKADHPILNEINIARVKGRDLRQHYNDSQMTIEWHHFEYVDRAYRHYKASHGLLDFTDLIEYVLQEPDRLPRLKALIVDEAQDLSRLQWRLVQALIARAERTYVAGDDDQAVYTWAGADVESFLTLRGNVRVLDQSYRVPSTIHALADRVVHRIRNRQEKTWRPRTEGGAIVYYNDFHHVDLTRGDWLVLAATNYMLSDMHEWIKSQGLLFERHGQRSISEAVLSAVVGWERLRKGQEIPFELVKGIYKYLDPSAVKHGHKSLKTADMDALYSHARLVERHGLLTDAIWHEALTKIGEDKRNYLVALLRRGIRLTDKAPIKLSTIHGAKGGEADNVLLLGDLSTRFAKEYDNNPDDINRLLYVGITRAKQALHVVLPRNNQKGFRL